jgi:hypothetical protein
MEMVGRVAEALGAIHEQMEAIDGAIKLHSGTMGTGPERNQVAFHGDFGMRNVFYLPESDRVAIIDWSNADWMGLDADLGPPEIDVAVFLMSLFRRRLFGPWPISRRHDLARHFLATYSAASPHGLDMDTLVGIVVASSSRFNQETRRLKGNLRALGYRHNMPDLCWFLRRLAGRRFTSGSPRHTG